MKHALPRLKRLLCLGAFTSLLAALGGSLAVIWHRLLTPQLLESTLPGQARLYRWRHGHIFYKQAGPEQGPPVVLWHAPGLAASAYVLRELAALLTEQSRLRVYLPDLLGFGLSDRPALAYSGALYVELVSDFLREVVGQPALLLAQGTSCQYALEVARRNPELCRGLVMLWPEHDSLPEQRRLRGLKWLVAPLARLPLVGLVVYCLLTTRLALRFLLAPGQTGSDLDYSYATTHQFGAEHAVLAWLADRLALMANGHFEVPTTSSPYPVLVVRAESDARAEPGWREPAEQAPGAEQLWMTLPGHTLDRQAASLISARLNAWISRGPQPVQTESTIATLSGRGEAEVASQDLEAGQTVSNETQMSPPSPTERLPVVEAYCVKCRQKSAMLNVEETTLKNGRPALQGTCARCGARMYRIGRR
ncbi:alpha/beta fold hydrolase [Thermogemmatispora sp.]|uniref:alpha/beta fold hydrolase n=1 Tax=Thermogemmatispora sp. TaxID=1968838 RepID=UPI001DCF98B8|nr:alpha/beta fold hydrolase [Thermogemmatispora sp.]MBX5452037.1 alpha/beta fold hydrolase [Thermogemmatispora sp.]